MSADLKITVAINLIVNNWKNCSGDTQLVNYDGEVVCQVCIWKFLSEKAKLEIGPSVYLIRTDNDFIKLSSELVDELTFGGDSVESIILTHTVSSL